MPDPNSIYFMEDSNGTRVQLETTNCERDLGILISANLKQHAQVNMAAAKANKILGMLTRSFTSRDPTVWKKLYQTYVRPNIEYSVQAWNPHLNKDRKVLEQIQHRATAIPHGFKHLSYIERCRRLGLTSLEERRLRGDLIQRYKFEKNIQTINWHFPPLTGHHTRFQRELVKNCDERQQFFNNRITNIWNWLPDSVVGASSINSFKNRLDAILHSRPNF